MPHYPKPFFRKSRKLWSVQLDGKQVNLGPDRPAAFHRYHEWMAQPAAMPKTLTNAVAFHRVKKLKRHRTEMTILN